MTTGEAGQPNQDAAFKAPAPGEQAGGEPLLFGQSPAVEAPAPGSEYDHLFADAPLTGSVADAARYDVAAQTSPENAAAIAAGMMGTETREDSDAARQATSAAVEAAAVRPPTTDNYSPNASNGWRGRRVGSPYIAPKATPTQVANAAKFGFKLDEHDAKYNS